MRTALLPFLAAAVTLSTFSTAAMAGPRTVRVQMYNTSAVAKSQCFVLGTKANRPYRRTLTTFTHTKKNGHRVFTYDVPSQYVKVDVMCKANGPSKTLDLEIDHLALSTHWVKVSCPSSQPDALCTVSLLGGDPEY